MKEVSIQVSEGETCGQQRQLKLKTPPRKKVAENFENKTDGDC